MEGKATKRLNPAKEFDKEVSKLLVIGQRFIDQLLLVRAIYASSENKEALAIATDKSGNGPELVAMVDNLEDIIESGFEPCRYD